ncbi:MAG: TIM barrel protein, partial [Clostridia bacterium]|nr:TIM barrel protein [Clostridia bacterium]
AHLEQAKNCFNNANILGAKNIRSFSFYLREGQSRDDARGEVIDKLGRLVDLADEYGVTLCHENEAKIYGESPERCLDILKALDGKLRCVFDMGNFVLDGHPPFPGPYELLRDYINYFHIKDSMSVGAIVPPGCGEAHIKQILAAHKAYTCSDFVVTLEPHLETFDGLNKLVGKTFENPYKFETPKIAFSTALDKLENIIAEIG